MKLTLDSSSSCTCPVNLDLRSTPSSQHVLSLHYQQLAFQLTINQCTLWLLLCRWLVAALEKANGQMRSILCLHESVVTGACDGYARIKGKPAASLLHLGPGLGNGLCNLHNARRCVCSGGCCCLLHLRMRVLDCRNRTVLDMIACWKNTGYLAIDNMLYTCCIIVVAMDRSEPHVTQ